MMTMIGSRAVRVSPGTLIGCVLMLLIAGCANVSPIEGEADVAEYKEQFSDLYKGKSTIAFATEFAPASAEEARQLGDLALQQQDLDRALFNYIQALNMDGEDALTLVKIAAIHDYRGNQDLAGLAYKRALQVDRHNTQALTGIGIILLKKREMNPAKVLLLRSVELDDSQWQAHNALGIIEDLQSNHQLAIAHFQVALQIKPESPMLMNNLGYSYYLSDSWAAARKLYQKALNVAPDYKRAWQNLGLLYSREENYRSALDAFSHAMETSQAYNDVGYLSMLEGKYALSERFLERAINESPSYYETANENIERLRQLKRSADGNPF